MSEVGLAVELEESLHDYQNIDCLKQVNWPKHGIWVNKCKVEKLIQFLKENENIKIHQLETTRFW